MADEEGYISELPALAFGKYAMKLGAGRTTKADTLNYETGIVFEKKVGNFVKVGETVANIYSEQSLTEELIDEFKAYITISNECKKPKNFKNCFLTNERACLRSIFMTVNTYIDHRPHFTKARCDRLNRLKS